MDLKVSLKSFIIFFTVISMSGCALFQQRRHHASSVVDYLYSGKIGKVEKPSLPVLRIPLKVGIAFVPTTIRQEKTLSERVGIAFLQNRKQQSEILSEKERIELMRKISDQFKKHDFVDSIEIIPTSYLKDKGGFSNLDQLRTMFGLDVITLLSYDQVQFSSEGFSSISYWTLVGAYIIKGEKNDTHTMIDATVYDIKSRKLLFRAPGTSQVKGKATPINLQEQLRLDREKGFHLAAEDLVPSLQFQLDFFREKIKEKRSAAKIVRRDGYTGGGRVDSRSLVVIVIIGGIFLWLKQHRIV